mmetsp:Transcript_24911/g.77446  ORF Transcript_24911/g.77446 Transcript_24911/m.77446 type:complete len:114 (+) Transcript_24911:82-423(+)
MSKQAALLIFAALVAAPAPAAALSCAADAKPCAAANGIGKCCPLDAPCTADGQCYATGLLPPAPSMSFLSPGWIVANPIWTWIFALLLIVLIIMVVAKLLRPEQPQYASPPAF